MVPIPMQVTDLRQRLLKSLQSHQFKTKDANVKSTPEDEHRVQMTFCWPQSPTPTNEEILDAVFSILKPDVEVRF